MMMETEDHLGLSLSLMSPPPPAADRRHLLALMPPSSSASSPPLPQERQYWNDLFFCPSERKACDISPFLRGIDVNRPPPPAAAAAAAAESEEEEAGVSSPNSTLSSLSGKRGLPAASGGEGEGERASSRGLAGGAGSDDEDGGGGGGGSRKKLRLSKEQAAVLEESFTEHNTLNPKQKQALAKQLNLKPRQVEVWFQNRRARTKLKQTEVDCEFLKRCCERLTEENRRLQKEVQELRALKLLSPHLYSHMPPPTTLTICPSCDRLSNNPSAGPGPALHRPVPPGPWPARPLFADGPGQRP